MRSHGVWVSFTEDKQVAQIHSVSKAFIQDLGRTPSKWKMFKLTPGSVAEFELETGLENM